jgi:hypothetical protein
MGKAILFIRMEIDLKDIINRIKDMVLEYFIILMEQ